MAYKLLNIWLVVKNNINAFNAFLARGHVRWGYWAMVGVLFFAFHAAAIGTPPGISVQPTNRVVPLGSNSVFTVTATSATTLTYQWYYNGAKITGATSNVYTLTKAQFTNAGPYYVAVINANGTVTSSVAMLNVKPPTGSTLASPWISADIGAVGLIGSAYNVTNLYTVNGAGASLVGAAADQFRYVYQTMVGDGSIVARIVSQSGVNANGYAGIMIRETTTTGASYMFAARQGDGTMVVRSRASTGGATTSTNRPALTLPNYWLELVRTGNKIAALTSTNGSTWVAVQTNTFTMATNVTFGLFVTSGNTNVLNSATFTNITAIP